MFLQEIAAFRSDREMRPLDRRPPNRDGNDGPRGRVGVAGVFLIVPFFFMDFKDAEELEIRILVRALVTAFEGERLKVARGLQYAVALMRELQAFERRVNERGHDGLVVAVALAGW